MKCRNFILHANFAQEMSVSKDQGSLTTVLVMPVIFNSARGRSLSHSVKGKTGRCVNRPTKNWFLSACIERSVAFSQC